MSRPVGAGPRVGAPANARWPPAAGLLRLRGSLRQAPRSTCCRHASGLRAYLWTWQMVGTTRMHKIVLRLCGGAAEQRLCSAAPSSSPPAGLGAACSALRCKRPARSFQMHALILLSLAHVPDSPCGAAGRAARRRRPPPPPAPLSLRFGSQGEARGDRMVGWLHFCRSPGPSGTASRRQGREPPRHRRHRPLATCAAAALSSIAALALCHPAVRVCCKSPLCSAAAAPLWPFRRWGGCGHNAAASAWRPWAVRSWPPTWWAPCWRGGGEPTPADPALAEGARRRLHRRRVAPHRELQGGHLRLGRPGQVLGLTEARWAAGLHYNCNNQAARPSSQAGMDY